MLLWVSIRVLILDGCNLHHVRHGHEPVVLFLPYQLFLVFSWHRRDQYQFFGPNEPNYFKKKKNTVSYTKNCVNLSLHTNIAIRL